MPAAPVRTARVTLSRLVLGRCQRRCTPRAHTLNLPLTTLPSILCSLCTCARADARRAAACPHQHTPPSHARFRTLMPPRHPPFQSQLRLCFFPPSSPLLPPAPVTLAAAERLIWWRCGGGTHAMRAPPLSWRRRASCALQSRCCTASTAAGTPLACRCCCLGKGLVSGGCDTSAGEFAIGVQTLPGQPCRRWAP